MIIALEDAKYELTNFRADLTELGSALRIDTLREQVAELEKKTSDPAFWNDQATSGKTLQQIKQLKDKINAYEALCTKLEDAITLAELAIEENDESMVEEVLNEQKEILATEEKMRIEILLSGEYDRNNASSASIRVQAEPKHRTGRRCSIVCTRAGENGTATT